MALILILLTIGLQRYTEYGMVLQRHDWFDPYFQWLQKHLKDSRLLAGYLGVATVIVPIWLLLLGLFALIGGQLFGLISFLLNMLVLLYCIDAREVEQWDKSAESPDAVNIFRHYYERVFAMIFWFVVFGLITHGALGAILYLMLIKCSNTELTASNKIKYVFDWIPTRLLSLTFLLVGHFKAGFNAFWEQVFASPADCEPLLVSTGLAAMEADAKASQLAMELIDRALFVWLLLLAIFTIVAWVS